MVKTHVIKATITDSGHGKLTLRLFISSRQKRELLLQRGKQPLGIFNLVIL